MDNPVLGCIGLLVLGLVVTAVSMVVNAWALAVLWGWFVAPLGLPTLTVAQAAGICLIVGFLIREAVDVEEGIDWPKAIAKTFVPALVAVGLGWVILWAT